MDFRPRDAMSHANPPSPLSPPENDRNNKTTTPNHSNYNHSCNPILGHQRAHSTNSQSPIYFPALSPITHYTPTHMNDTQTHDTQSNLNDNTLFFYTFAWTLLNDTRQLFFFSFEWYTSIIFFSFEWYIIYNHNHITITQPNQPRLSTEDGSHPD